MDQDELNAKFVELVINRIGHMETLLLGLATVGLAGWGFLHAGDWQLKNPSDFLFPIVFSGLVATAYNALFMGRMSLNVTLIKVEDALDSDIRPYAMYFENVGSVRARIVYYGTAIFIPIIALGSLILTLRVAIATLENMRETSVFLLWSLSSLLALTSSISSILYIEKAMRLIDPILQDSRRRRSSEEK